MSLLTIFRTKGLISTIVGNATLNANAHAFNQMNNNPLVQPKLNKVITNDIIHDIVIDITKANTML